jgi:hypothetical protein
MAIADRIGINASGVIYYDSAAGANDHTTATAEYFTVIQFHRFLQDLADDATASGDDLIDITSTTPSDRSTDNIITVKTGYTLDDGTVGGGDPVWEHLYDGSIIVEGENGRTFDGLVVIANEGMDLQIIQNGAILTDDWWNSVPNGEAAGSHGLNRDTANGISHRFMLEVIDNTGTDIDGRRLVGITREEGFTFSEFKINGTSNGNNVLALTYVNDLNDSTDASLRTTIDNQTYGYVSLDIDGNSTGEPYYSEWNMDTYNSKEFYERLKWLTACESGTTNTTANSTTMYGLDGNIFRGITHELTGTQASGNFNAAGTSDVATGVGTGGQPEPVSWTGGTGQMLAVDSTSAATSMWIQILTGTAPTSGTVTAGITGATFTVSGNTEYAVPTPFCGSSTGTALIGSRGFGMETADTSASDIFTDLDGNVNNPPNNVTFSVNGVEATEDRVLVGPANGTALRSDQMQVATAEAITVTAGSVSSATSGAGTVVMASNTETIGTGQPSGTDTPGTGTIRVLDANGIFQIINYTGWTAGSGTLTFTGCTGTGTWSAAVANDSFISYIDKVAASDPETFTVVYSTGNPRSLFIRVRDGGTAGDLEGIKTFESTGTLGAAGGSSTVIRTSDV